MEQEQNIEQVFHPSSGRLAAERPKGGTGIARFFNENGTVKMEGWMQNGVHVGYVKIFDTDGTLLMVKFWNALKYISKKKYQALCDKDPSLPRFEDIDEYNFLAEDLKRERRQEREEAKRIRNQDNSEALQKSEAFCEQVLKRGRTEEAISWLKDKSKGVITLGELQTNKESLKLAQKIYRLGAEKVLAVEIGSDEHGENSGKLIIVLPDDPERRKRLFRWSNTTARSLGFDPDVDIGQKHLFAMLD
jgi:hypothetical protein